MSAHGAMRTEARFPGLDRAAGHYESFYVKATRPGGGRAIWIRQTVHKRPGSELTGSVWFTLFDADADGPRATKLTLPASGVAAPPGAYIRVGESVLGPGGATGGVTTPELEVSWELELAGRAAPFRHLPYDFLYRAPLPKTKLLSPNPDARVSGSVTIAGERFELEGWPGMLGHNWGTEHAERWIWMQASELGDADGWFDAALGRIKVGPFTTPWVANAMLCLDGERHRLGGLDRIRSAEVAESPTRCEFELTGRDVSLEGRVTAEPRDVVAWVYADPAGPEHHSLNCSISDMELTVERKGREPRRLECAGAAAYEIGMRETDHGVGVQPYPDG